jgi:hypothetical protein
MPIIYRDNWNSISLKRLTKDDNARNIFHFWRAKTRFHADGPKAIQALEAMPHQNKPMNKANKAIYGEGTPAAVAQSIKAALKMKPDGSFDKGDTRLTTSMVRKFNGGLSSGDHFDVPSKQLDGVMKDIQIDRLRIGDRHMLASASAVDITRALFDAHSRFNSNPKVAALLSRAVAADGPPVEVTQGVHQSNDPHFDLLMPGEAEQYHLNVAYGEKPLRIVGISYMNPTGSATRTTDVAPDS